MLSTSDFKRGARIVLDGEPWVVEDYTVQTPSARGAATLVRTRLRNVITGALLEKTFKSGEKFDEPDVRMRKVQFLYSDGDGLHFMDNESYEQHTLSEEQLGDSTPWLVEGGELMAVLYNGRMVGVSLPPHAEVEVRATGAGARGDTASGKNLKDAELANGLSVKVPLFVEPGDRIVVDTRTLEFVRRAR